MMKPDEPTRFDELTKALATTTTRRQVLKAFAATAFAGLVGGAGLGAERDTALAGSCAPNSACAKFCATMFGANTAKAGACTSEANKCQGLCYTCGPGANPHNLQPCPGGTLPGTTFPGSCCAAPTGGTATCTSSGTCGSTCASGYTACNGQCVNTSTDPKNCGTCGITCSSTNMATVTCSGRVCTGTCAPGYADCDGNKQTNGCETALTTTSNCGACGVTCLNPNGTTTCTNGTCMPICAAGYGDCDGHPANGCETALTTLANCGGCGVSCNPAQSTAASCSSGTCQATSCAPGYGLSQGACVACGAGTYAPGGTTACTPCPSNSYATGNANATCVACACNSQCQTCVSTSGCMNTSDGTACNDGNACTQTDTCQSGVCVGGNPVVCAAADQCHVAGTCDPGTGTCSNPAAPNGATCTGSDSCYQTYTCQSGSCTGSNPVICGTHQVCSGGTCLCMTGYMTCSGLCVDTSSDPSNCGSCGHTCATGQTCSNGSCVCTATSCPNGCCDTSQTCQLTSNDSHCGTGGVACATCTAPQTCGGGGTANVCGCTPATCTSLKVYCGSVADGCGNNLDCGYCGPNEFCDNGICVVAACFTGRTRILMADHSTRAIAEVAVGDRVLAFNEERREVQARAVVAIHPHQPESYLHIWLADGRRLEVTRKHRISRHGEWIVAGELAVGDELDVVTDDAVGLEGVAVERIEPSGWSERVYNLTVEECHTYFANGVLVHNLKI